MIFSLAESNQLIIDYRYIILFPIAVFEGPIITVIAGFLSSMKELNFFLAYITVVVGDLTGDSLYYLLGRYGRAGWMNKFGKYLGVIPEETKKLEDYFEDHGGKTLLIGKFTHGVGTAFLAAAGLAKMRFDRFLFYNIIGTLPKSMLLILLGYYFGRAVTKINSILELIGAIFLSAGVIGFLIYYFYYRNRKK